MSRGNRKSGGDEKPRRKNSRAKGAVGERELAEVLRAAGWPGARRGQQRSGLDQADVIGGPENVHLECKRVETLRLWPAIEQAARDAPAGTVPVVVHRRSRSGWVAILDLRALLSLLREVEGQRLLHGPLDLPARS